jgi:response regulator RpfG family c-di-GMP phosphodiesterase
MLRGDQSREVLINVRGVELIAREVSQFQASDMAGQTDRTESMTYITRDEFSARIEVIETRIDARIESMSAKIDGFLTQQAERDKVRLEQEQSQETARLERERSQEEVRLERERAQEEVRVAREQYLEDLRQEREKIERRIRLAQEKVHQERDKRYALMTARMDRSLERIDEAMRMVSTNKANYWAATTVHFLGMVAILVGSY